MAEDRIDDIKSEPTSASTSPINGKYISIVISIMSVF